MMLSVVLQTPERTAFSGEARAVVVPGVDGELGIFPGHAPLVAVLGPGEVRVRDPKDQVVAFYVAGGVARVLAGEVRILVDDATPAGELPAGEVLSAAVSEAVALPQRTEAEYLRRARTLAEARIRMRVARRVRGG